MRDEPDIGREAIAGALRDAYAVEVRQLEFWPEGEASYGYIAHLAGGQRWFVKLLDERLSTHQPALRSLARFLPLTSALGQAGLPVSRPVSTRRGAAHCTAGPFTLLAHHFVPGESLGESPWPVDCYASLGHTVGRLHALTEQMASLTPSRDALAIPPRTALESLLEELERVPDHGSRARYALRDRVCPLRHEALGHYDYLCELLAPVLARRDSWVLSHTDLTGGNLIRSPQSDVHIIDWEGAALAPREWDVAFFLHEPYAERFGPFLHAYEAACASPRLDPDTFVARMYHRNFEDFFEGCRFVLDEDVSEEELRHGTEVVFDACVGDWPFFGHGRQKVARLLAAHSGT